ncbi:hypothetical protein Gotri_019248 [Gossypium trilobum]|uniref:Uncharacterized protein n=1 Tax=Gossypium trilobum TaxID=34281 RepID=A0A7J9EC90_9ROSI|nr:hypothetical protein [Gossypium trilobum]
MIALHFLHRINVLIHVQLLNRDFVMENEFLDKVDDNAAVRIWSEKTQLEKGDSLTEGLVVFPKALGHVDEAVSDLRKVHRMCATLANLVLQPLLESRLSFLSGSLYLGFGGATGYASLLVFRQYRLRQFIPDFEKRNSELGKKIEQFEEKKLHLRLDVDVQKLEAEKLRKGKNNAEEDLDSLKIDYKKL